MCVLQKDKRRELVIYCSLSKKEKTKSGEKALSARSRNLNFILKTIGATDGF